MLNVKLIVTTLCLLLLVCDSVVESRKKKGNKPPCSTRKSFGSASYKFFGVRTLYKYARKKLPTTSNRSPENCHPVHIYLIARHGARLPHKGTRREQLRLQTFLRTLNSTGNAKLCSADMEALRNWVPWVGENVDKNQTEYGDNEIRGIAKRFLKLLPELFPTPSAPFDFRFRSSDYQRTIASMRVFAKEIFKKGRPRNSDIERTLQEANLQVVPLFDDTYLRFNLICQKYLKTVMRNSSRYAEYKNMLSGPLVDRIIRSVAFRLGVPKTSITPKFLYTIYLDGCSLQQWNDAENGPWCFPFSKKDLKALDYLTDVKEYWHRRHANRITREMSCDLAKDIMGSLNDAAESDRRGDDFPKGTFRFAHVTAVLSTAANFGLYQEDDLPVTEENYRSLMRNRKFSMARLSPSAGNLAFVLYKCGEEYKVQTFLNEGLTSIPGCSESDGKLCPLGYVLDHYRDFVPGSESECNYDEICQV
ncbi:multiple inositol polyphosphate phosphatase 1-like [Clavelina lepadiformis]|uniref:multiple inositol polyphosphate phosphatase 1-like n=1 Tax=Clavelina lepadiformis TaxID=159417 RepID=UPI004041DF62